MNQPIFLSLVLVVKNYNRNIEQALQEITVF